MQRPCPGPGSGRGVGTALGVAPLLCLPALAEVCLTGSIQASGHVGNELPANIDSRAISVLTYSLLEGSEPPHAEEVLSAQD